jgi:hypothetical protein
LEKVVHALYKKHLNMSETNIIQHVVKYKIPEKMVGSPKWHYAQLFDMIAMVDTYGLLHIFFTFFSNETSEFKWGDISNMETFLKDLGEDFTWKNCPLECAHLFHKKICTLMTKYINCENEILGCVEHHMC